jgi:predicted O-linked N-acetylglucosamine transferase (SPINDLY family)
LDDYVAKAVYYGSKPGVYAAMREKLGRQAEESPLFDMVGFVRGFEGGVKFLIGGFQVVNSINNRSTVN